MPRPIDRSNPANALVIADETVYFNNTPGVRCPKLAQAAAKNYFRKIVHFRTTVERGSLAAAFDVTIMQSINEKKATRRDFLKATGLTTVAFGFPTIIPASALGQGDKPAPSNRIVMGGIGLGNMGSGDMNNFLNNPLVQYVAVCEVRGNVRNERKNQVDGKYGNKDSKAYVDFRELLAREDIDAVHIATPDHWHGIQIIEACRAGKDVFCQKPETRTLREGQLVVEAARRYGRVVSGGSQRVLEDYRDIVRKCWGGELGPVKAINVEMGTISKACNLPAEDCPADMDWEMWLGPAPWAPYNHSRCDGNFSCEGGSWRSYSDYSGGNMTDWGAHHIGGATFAVDVREQQPTDVILTVEGDKRWLSFKYANGVELTLNKPGKSQHQVDGTPGEKREPKKVPEYAAKGGIGADFLECIKTRGKPFRDIEFAVNTVTVCHLGIIAYTLGRSLKWDAAKQQFIGDEEANRLVDRACREPWQL